MKPLIVILMLPLLLISCGKKQNEEQEPSLNRDFNSFVFVGMIDNHPGLYKYNVINNTFNKFWQSSQEEVVELSYSDDHRSAFFLTATKEGKEGIFPFIKDARLYVIPDSSSKPQFIKEIGSGLQVFSRWESETVFRIVINFWDKKVSTYINQKTIIFNTYGRILQQETKTYDVTTDGYPRLPGLSPDSLSPSGKFQISYKKEPGDSVFLIQRKDNNEFFITKINKPITEIKWSDDRSLIFILTLDVTLANRSIVTGEPNTSTLYEYSVSDKILVKEWKGGGYKNFFTISDFLIFDDGFGINSSINIYNFKENKIIKQIKVKGGCGLRGIPEIPRSGV
jgi:hypothetical protein